MLAGNRVLPGMQPYAARYGGHQFGHWAGQLGDGRAITLGEIVAADGTRQELQLKGAGRTPYSRTADGRAVLRSSLREFMCSEAMHFLGVPTTRALSLVATGEPVIRDMFYDGHPAPEPGAVVCRVAPSFVRFGNFQIHAAHNETEPAAPARRLRRSRAFPGPRTYSALVQEICRRTALLIVDWMRLGFVHGVMNTDNMSILGVTIDYGPYGWLEGYDPQWTPNTTDAPTRRYAYGNQPQIAQWNLARFAEALLPLVGDKAPLEKGSPLRRDLQQAWRSALAQKLGWPRSTSRATTSCCPTSSACSTRSRPTSRSSSATCARAARQRRRAVLEEAFYSEPPAAPPGAGELAATLCRALARGGARPRRAHEPGQSEVRVPQLPRPARDRCARAGRHLGDGAAARGARAALRRAAGAPRPRRAPAGMGAAPRRLLRPLLQQLVQVFSRSRSAAAAKAACCRSGRGCRSQRDGFFLRPLTASQACPAGSP